MPYSKIFLIDDQTETNLYHRTIVEQTKPELKVIEFDDPINAKDCLLKELLSLPLNKKILILLDYRMPTIDGLDFLDEIEEEFDLESNTDIYFVSNDRSAKLREKVPYYNQVKGLLEKPISREEFERILN